MYDMHYDLLTILYYYFKRHESFDHLANFIPMLQKTYNENIKGGIINLYFMDIEDMKNELDISEPEVRNVIEMFKKSQRLLENVKTLGLIPEDIDFIHGIEGCSYIKSIQELEELYELGLRSIIPTYNEQNKFGSGCLKEGGLTNEGYELINKAIELGIIIDVSHANEETFYDILNFITRKKQEGLNPIVIASHSNVKDLCNRKRNLTKEQLLRLKECDGYISLFTNGNFVSLNNESLSYKERQQEFLKHIDYIRNKIQFSDDRILLASDDMNFHPDVSYHNLEVFPLDKIAKQLRHLLNENYNEEFTRKVMIENAKDLINKTKEKQKVYHNL